MLFSWNYSDQEQLKIDGFKLYRNGALLVRLPAFARSIDLNIKDGNNPNKWELRAFKGSFESDPATILSCKIAKPSHLSIHITDGD